MYKKLINLSDDDEDSEKVKKNCKIKDKKSWKKMKIYLRKLKIHVFMLVEDIVYQIVQKIMIRFFYVIWIIVKKD